MSRQLDELLLRRGRLIERIAGQRGALRHETAPVALALGRVDLVIAGVRSGAEYFCRHALAVSLIAGSLLLFQRKATLRWAGRAFALWKSWHAVRSALSSLESRVR
ncbi:MAG: hypothetical protein LBE85_12790 [Candidatus Accumulibacter sp.]|jgi:hypothetical protein|nr:hypothetical protein [Accumulibacter sp.]